MIHNLMHMEPAAAPRPRMSAPTLNSAAFGTAGSAFIGTGVTCDYRSTAAVRVQKDVFPGVRAWSPPV
jgi:hypothetical protein